MALAARIEPAAPEPRPARWAPHLAAFLVLFAVAAALQLVQPHPFDADAGYHVAVARLVRDHGLLKAFPWTPFSWLAEHWADKELLFHLLIAPFAELPYVTAARVGGTIAGGLALAATYGVLRAERVPGAVLWALLPLAASGAFVLRFAAVRPHVLALAVLVPLAWAAARRRLLLLGALAAIYPWIHIGWPLAFGLVVAAEVARALAGERPSPAPLAATAAGLAVGLVSHPDFPEVVRLAWIVHGRILVETAWAERPGFELGAEFQPPSLANALRYLGVPCLLAVAAAALAARRRRESPVPLTFTLAAVAFLALTFRSFRFLELSVPFAAAALALSVPRRPTAVGAAVLAGALAFTAAFGAAPAKALVTRGADVPAPFERVFREAIPEGAQVFTCEWGLTGELMLALPRRRFIVALDPVLFYVRDPVRYQAWYRLPREGGPGAAEEIRRTFGARFVLCGADPRWSPLLKALTADPGVRRIVKSPLWFLYDLEPVSAPASGVPPLLAPARSPPTLP